MDNPGKAVTLADGWSAIVAEKRDTPDQLREARSDGSTLPTRLLAVGK